MGGVLRRPVSTGKALGFVHGLPERNLRLPGLLYEEVGTEELPFAADT
jgi:hypothetical protein